MAAINGTDLLVYVDGVAIGCSTTCTLNLNQEVVEATCKDGGSWNDGVAGRKSWDVTCDALYQIENDAILTGLTNLIIGTDLNSVTIDFGQKDENFYWSGTAIMTSISVTGDDNTPSSYSATFQGIGALTMTEV